MNFGISFAPLVPAYLIWAAVAVAVIISALLLFIGSRGALLRATAMAFLILALANPSFTREDREPIPSVVAVVIDKSPSQNFGNRAKQTEEARAALIERLARIPNLDVRVVDAGAADGADAYALRSGAAPVGSGAAPAPVSTARAGEEDKEVSLSSPWPPRHGSRRASVASSLWIHR